MTLHRLLPPALATCLILAALLLGSGPSLVASAQTITDPGSREGEEVIGDEPGPGVDLFPTSAVIEIKIGGEKGKDKKQEIPLLGDTVIRRIGVPETTGNETTIPIEIVSMNLTGVHPQLGPVDVRSDVPAPGMLEFKLAPLCPADPTINRWGDSFFDITYRIEFVGMTLQGQSELKGSFQAMRQDDPPTTILELDLGDADKLGKKEDNKVQVQLKDIAIGPRPLQPGNSFFDVNFYDTFVAVDPLATDLQHLLDAQLQSGISLTCEECLSICEKIPAYFIKTKLICIGGCFVSGSCP